MMVSLDLRSVAVFNDRERIFKCLLHSPEEWASTEGIKYPVTAIK